MVLQYPSEKAYVFEQTVETLTAITQEVNDLHTLMRQIDELVDEAGHSLKMTEEANYALTKGTVAEREKQLYALCEDANRDYMEAKRVMSMAKRRMEYLKMAFEATRTIAATRRAEFMAEPTGQWS